MFPSRWGIVGLALLVILAGCGGQSDLPTQTAGTPTEAPTFTPTPSGETATQTPTETESPTDVPTETPTRTPTESKTDTPDGDQGGLPDVTPTPDSSVEGESNTGGS